MHLLDVTRRLMLSGLALAAGATMAPRLEAQQPNTALPAPAGKAPTAKVGKTGELIVPLAGIVEFTPELPKGRLWKSNLTANDQIVQTKPNPSNPKAVLLVGVNPGLTKLTFELDDNSKAEFEVIVQPDYDLLRKVLAQAVPTASVQIIPGVGNTIILTGYVNKPEDADIVVRIATAAVGGVPGQGTAGQNNNQAGGGTQGGAGGAGGAAGGTGNSRVINAIQVGGVQHVMIEVVVAQVDRTELRERGADFVIGGSTGSFSSVLSGLLTVNGFTALGALPTANANIRFGIVPSQIFGALRALRTEGLAKFLSEPKVVTQSGRVANIRSGGQQAVLSATGGGIGSISVSLEQVGTQLEVLPIVYGNGKIYLEVNPSIRARNDGFGIQTTAGFSPGFTEQSTRASVMLESGQTFAIGGLLETTTQAVNVKVPFIGDLPFIGTAFSTIRHDERERELIVLVTPRLVDALDCNQTPRRVPGRETRSPDDYELYLEGLLEAPRGQRQVWNGRCYQAAYKCDPTAAQFPCRGDVCGPNGGANCATGVLTAAPSGLPNTLPGMMPGPIDAMPLNTGGVPVMPAPLPVPLPVGVTTTGGAVLPSFEVPVPDMAPVIPVIVPPAFSGK